MLWLAHRGHVLSIVCALAAASCDAAPAGPSAGSQPAAVPSSCDVEPHYCACESVPAVCDAAATISPGSRALIVTDPAALAALPLRDVLSRIQELGGDPADPLFLVQQLFDTTSTTQAGAFASSYHCDSPDSPAHVAAPAASCPRAEAALARRSGFFDPGSPDEFYPVAAVNRFDLAVPFGGGSPATCGEYRLVYAKRSGLSDPNQRAFIVLESSLPNPPPGCLAACAPVQALWRSFDAEPDAAAVGAALRSFFFAGVGGFRPPLSPESFGLGTDPAGDGSSAYYARDPGQVRLSANLDQPWELRELHLGRSAEGRLQLVPVQAKGTPVASLFAPTGDGSTESPFQQAFVRDNARSLGAFALDAAGSHASLSSIELFVRQPYWAGESAVEGPARSDYEAAAQLEISAAFRQDLEGAVATYAGSACPPDDPVTPAALLRRAAAQSCAGCHAPSRILGPGRGVGCGLAWPDSLGGAHVDERGQLSPALTQVFLPRRAHVLERYLRACDQVEVDHSFEVTAADP